MKIMGFFEKWFCKHRWTFHDKKEVVRTKIYMNGLEEKDHLTIEILICEKCGNVKKLRY